jgi:signal transduction histidine kinase
MGRLSVRTKVFFLFAGASLLAVVPALILISQAVEDRVYERATQELVSASEALRTYWSVQDEALQENARRIALEREVPELLAAGDTAALRRTLARGVTERRVALAVDSVGTSLLGPPLDSATLHTGSDKATVAFYSDGGSPLRISVWPVWTDRGRVGMVGVGSRIDERVIREIRDITGGTDVALIVSDSILATTLPDSLARVLQTMDLPLVVQRGGIWRREVERLPYLYSVNRLTSSDASGAVLLLRPIAQELRVARGIQQSLVGIGLATLVISLLLALIVARIVARPAQALAAAAGDLARGDYDAPLPRDSGDEIGQLTRAFRDMRAAIAKREEQLRSTQAELIHREKLAAMGRLVAQLSHEINNPIYNIQNCLEVLDRRGDPGDPNREFLELAQEELQRMAVLTRQLLDQSRPLSEAAAAVDLNQVIQRVMALAHSRLDAHGVGTHLELEAGLPAVIAHADAMQQVLANLVDNAVDAMPGGGLLQVSSRQDGDIVEIVVVDSGAGIDEEHLPRVFEAFYTTKPGVRGIGLGLFVSEGIVRGHRGSLTVASGSGEGTRFTIRLPLEPLDPAFFTAGTGAADAAAGVQLHS